MGLSPELLRSSLRFSLLGEETGKELVAQPASGVCKDHSRFADLADLAGQTSKTGLNVGPHD